MEVILVFKVVELQIRIKDLNKITDYFMVCFWMSSLDPLQRS